MHIKKTYFIHLLFKLRKTTILLLFHILVLHVNYKTTTSFNALFVSSS